MSDDGILGAARASLSEAGHRVIDLVRSLPDTATPVPDSDWTTREATVHLVAANTLYREIATGTSSPVASLDKQYAAEFSDARIADVAVGEPDKLAALLTEGLEEFLSATVGCAGNQPVVFHAGLPFDVERVLCVALGEYVIHGYDIAAANGVPWPIDPADALLILHGYSAVYSLCVNAVTTAGLTASFRIELRGAEPFIARFHDGAYSLETDASVPVDCTIEADPVAFLLIGTGRLNRWEATALGLFVAGGDRPELAYRFPDLFVFP